jgi:hypothetical protein
MVNSGRIKPVMLDLRSVTPRITVNTAMADVRVLICHRNDSITALGADSLFFCDSTQPFTPGTLTIGHDDPGQTSIVLAITTRHLGTVRIEGVHVNYHDGLRRGSQDTGSIVEVRAVPPAPQSPPITQPPTVTAVLPAGGTTAGGTRVTIVGTNFAEPTTVRFGSIDVTGKEISVVSRGKLVVLAPAHAAGTVDVRVVTTHGLSPIATGDRFTYR